MGAICLQICGKGQFDGMDEAVERGWVHFAPDLVYRRRPQHRGTRRKQLPSLLRIRTFVVPKLAHGCRPAAPGAVWRDGKVGVIAASHSNCSIANVAVKLNW